MLAFIILIKNMVCKFVFIFQKVFLKISRQIDVDVKTLFILKLG